MLRPLAWAPVLALLAGCPDDLPSPRVCAVVPNCPAAPCCDQQQLCKRMTCGEVEWICRATAGGDFAWGHEPGPCSADGAVPRLDKGPGDQGAPDGKPPADTQPPKPDLPPNCGQHASLVSTQCTCDQGYVNTDGLWGNGCEDPDPACSTSKCDHCVPGYCGPNTRCTPWGKCRCIDGNWLNANGSWSDGCEEPTVDCRPDNCNNCYTGYCGPYADCMQNNCKCVVTGWKNCDGKWELNGCECNGTCSGSSCI